MATGKEILALAVREIGYREGAGQQNKFGAWYGVDGVAWCMQFVQWCYAQAGAPLPFRTASCGALLRWYRSSQPECVVEEPAPGCIVIFDWPGTGYDTDHAGLFVSKTAAHITTIDGNTSSANDSGGGYVMQRTRALSYANPVYIRPRELTQEEDENMKRYNTIQEIERDAPWAVETVKKLAGSGALKGNSGQLDGNGFPSGLDLSTDLLRGFVVNDRMGLYR